MEYVGKLRNFIKYLKSSNRIVDFNNLCKMDPEYRGFTLQLDGTAVIGWLVMSSS